jgi:hypothetical protein
LVTLPGCRPSHFKSLGMKARNFKYGNDKSNNSQPEYNFECPFLLASKNGSAVCCSSSVLESWQVAKPKRVVPLLGQLDSNVQKRCGDVPNSCALRKVVIGWVTCSGPSLRRLQATPLLQPSLLCIICARPRAS